MAIKIPSLFNSSTKNAKDDFGEFSELDNWQSDLDNFNFDDPVNTTNRKPKNIIKQGLTHTFKSTLKHLGPAIFTKTRAKFTNTDALIDDATRLKDELSYIKGEFLNEINPSIRSFKETGRILNSKVGSHLPNGVSDKINNILKDTDEDTEYKAPSKEEVEKQAVSESLGKIFQEQAIQQDKKDVEEAKDKIIDRSIGKFRHEQTAELLNQIRINTAAERLFRKSTFTAYLKKDLELKYKHLFVAKETLSTIQATSKIFESKLNAIVLNTSLPDIQKKKLVESVKSGLEFSLGTRFSNLGKDALQKAVDRLKSNAKEGASMLNMVTDMFGMLGSFAGMADFVNPGELAGDFAGSGIAGFIGERIARKLFGEEGIYKKQRELIELYAGNVSGKLSSHLRRLQSTGGSSPLGYLLNFIAPAEKRLVNKARTPEDPVPFDTATKTSLVSIIPGYLARILQQVTNIATGSSNELLRYDYKTHTFLKESDWHRTVGVRLAGKKEERTQKLGEFIGKLRGNYTSLHGKEEIHKFDSITEDIKTAILNSKRLGGLDFDDITRYVYSGGDLTNPEYKWDTIYIKDLLRGIYDKESKNSDVPNDYTDKRKLQVAEQLALVVNKSNITKKDKDGKDVTYRFVRDSVAQQLALRDMYEYFDQDVDPRLELSRLQTTGQLEGIRNILEYSPSGTFKIRDDKWRALESNTDPKLLAKNIEDYTSSGINAYKYYTSNENIDPYTRELIQRAGEGDLNALKDIKDIFVDNASDTATTYLNVINKYVKDPKLLGELLKKSELIKKLNLNNKGKEDSKSFLETMENFTMEKYHKASESVKKHVSDFWNRIISDSEEVKKKQAEQDKLNQELSTINDTYINDIIKPELSQIQENINKLLKKETSVDAPQVVKQAEQDTSIAGRTQGIIDAIVHFETVFVDYVKYQQEHQPVITINKYVQQSKELEENIDNKNISQEVQTKKPTIIEPQAPVTKEQAKSFAKFQQEEEKKRRGIKEIWTSLQGKFNELEWVKTIKDEKTINELKKSILTGKIVTDNKTVKELYEKYKILKNDPEQLDQELENLKITAQTKYEDIKNSAVVKPVIERVNKFKEDHKEQIESIQTSISETKNDAFGFIKKQYDKFKVYAQKKKNLFVDVYSSDILTVDDKNKLDPLVKAEQFRDGLLVFKDGTQVPDSYSIDRPVYLLSSDRSSKSMVITNRDISNGIYDEDKNDITKRSFHQKVTHTAKTITTKAVGSALDLAKMGIEGGIKTALLGMGLYGQIYYQLLRFGWSLSKGVLGGLFNRSVGGKALGLFGSGLKTVGKMGLTAGIGALSLPLWLGKKAINGVFGTNIPGPMGLISKLWGFDRIGENIKNKATSAKEFIFGNKDKGKDSIFTKIGNLGRNDPANPNFISGLIPSLGKKDPVAQMAKNIEKIAENTEDTADSTKVLAKDVKKKNSWWNKIQKLLGGIGNLFGVDTNSIADTASDALSEAAGEVVGDVVADKLTGNKKKDDDSSADVDIDKDDKDKKNKDKKDKKGKSKTTKKPAPSKPGRLPGRRRGVTAPKVSVPKAPIAPAAPAMGIVPSAATGAGETVAKNLGTKAIGYGVKGMTMARMMMPYVTGLQMFAEAIQQYDQWATEKGDPRFINSKAITENLENQGYDTSTSLEDIAQEAANRTIANRQTAQAQKDISDLQTLQRTSHEEGKNASNALGTITCPTESTVVTSPYGKRDLKKGSKFHKGIDLRASTGANIRAMADGKVTKTSRSFGEIMILHKDNIVTRYLHNSQILVSPGTVVKSGDIIAKAGGIGPSGYKEYDPHLHFEVKKGKDNLDPERYLLAAGIKLTRKPDLPNMEPLSDAGVENIEEKKSDTSTTAPDKSATTKEAEGLVKANPDTYKDTATLNNNSANINSGATADMSTVLPEANSTYNPDAKSLGVLSDKYKINENENTLKEFIDFCSKQDQVGKEVAKRLSVVKGQYVQDEWNKLSAEGKLKDLEHKFIEKERYGKIISGITNTELTQLVDKSNTIKDVIWSTAIDNDVNAAIKLLDSAWKSGISPIEFIRNVYQKRSSNNPKNQAKFKEELSTALAGLDKEGLGIKLKTIDDVQSTTPSTPSSNISTPVQVIPAIYTQPTTSPITVNQKPLVDTLPEQQPTSIQRQTITSTKKEDVTNDNYKVLDSILQEIKIHSVMLDNINKSVGGVTAAVDRSTDGFNKILGAFSGKGNTPISPKPATTTAVHTRPQQASPKVIPQLDVYKRNVG